MQSRVLMVIDMQNGSGNSNTIGQNRNSRIIAD